MKKRLIICCDGTWQTLKQADPTNVAIMAQAIEPVAPGDIHQITYYDNGVGAVFDADDDNLWQRITSWWNKRKSGAVGAGLEEKIFDAYRFLALNYTPGDEIFLFGFSRGAFTVRSLAGLIYCSGLVHRDNLGQLHKAYSIYRDRTIKPSSREAGDFREKNAHEVDINFLGCWDTVGMLGVPDLTDNAQLDAAINKRHAFHDTTVNHRVLCARQACALDEERAAFPLTAMTPSTHEDAPDAHVIQRWFIGPHGGVGGGESQHRGLSDIALKWMAGQAREQGLAISETELDDRLEINLHTAISPPDGLLDHLGSDIRDLGPEPTVDLLHPTVIERYSDGLYRPDSLRPLEDALGLEIAE